MYDGKAPAPDVRQPGPLDKWVVDMPEVGPVKLVALCRPDEKPLRFWNPDGNSLPGFGADMAAACGVDSGVAVAAVLERPMHERGERPAADGKFYSAQRWYARTDMTRPVAMYGKGYGKWEDCGRLEIGKVLRYEGHDYAPILVEEPTGTGHSRVRVILAYTFDMAHSIRVVAVDAEGGRMPFAAGDEYVGNYADGWRMINDEAIFDTPLSKIAYLVLQRRPLVWARFSGFATHVASSVPDTQSK
jgi:hypothetical protein